MAFPRRFLFALCLSVLLVLSCGRGPVKKVPADDDNSSANNGAANNGGTSNQPNNNGTFNNGATNNGTFNNGASNNGTLNNGASNNGQTANNGTGTNNGTAVCGNGLLEPGELCDGDCPTSCDDANACTRDTLIGSSTTCDARCNVEPVTQCVGGDGCCPAGCSFDNDSDCACPAATCADLGYTCGTWPDGCGGTLNCGVCPQGSACDVGTCVMVTNPGELGDTCTADSQCQGGLCLTQQRYALPGGYCSKPCSQNADCGANGFCTTGGFCRATCSSDTDCRTNWHCDAFGSYDSCIPRAIGTRGIGQACTSYFDCAGGRDGECASPARGWSDGYCTESCSQDIDCPFGSHCLTGRGMCVKSCTSDSSCRASGYGCYDVNHDGVKECFVSGTGNGQIGQPCLDTADCSGGNWARCGTPEQGFPNGYCSMFCGENEGTCPFGSTCDAVNLVCVDDCASNNDCRSGYSCKQPSFLSPTDACWPD